MGRDRCIWGTNGLPWKESLKQLCDLGLKEEVQRKVLRENAIELFKLDPRKDFADHISTGLEEAAFTSPVSQAVIAASQEIL